MVKEMGLGSQSGLSLIDTLYQKAKARVRGPLDLDDFCDILEGLAYIHTQAATLIAGYTKHSAASKTTTPTTRRRSRTGTSRVPTSCWMPGSPPKLEISASSSRFLLWHSSLSPWW